jgi:DNA adenine methylase
MTTTPGRYLSPLRYPGGKGKIANYIKLVILQNNLVGQDYVEVYAGGASVALSLLFEDWVDCIHINDINPGIYAFWTAVRDETDSLCERIAETPVTVDEWHRQRDTLVSTDATSLDVAFATFFLTRTNRSGIVGGGVIGGLDQTGPWKIDARYNRSDLIRRIKKIGRHRSRIAVTQTDGSEFVRRWAADRTTATLYLDPPYFVKGQGLYDNFYTSADHEILSDVVATLSHPWVVSYDAAPEIMALYASYDSIQYSLSYSAHSRSTGSEIMFFSLGLEHPEGDPAGIQPSFVTKARAASVAV